MQTVKQPEVSSVTYRKYENTYGFVRDHFGGMALSSISRMDYQAALNEFAASHAHHTVQDLHRQMNSCLEYALYDGIIDHNPAFKAAVKGTVTERVKILHVVDSLDLDQVAKLTAALKPLTAITPEESGMRSANPQYWDLMILLALRTGMRLAETIGLTWDRIQLGRHAAITVNRTRDYKQLEKVAFKPTKTKSGNRTISIDDDLADTLDAYKKQIEGQEESLLFGFDGIKVSAASSMVNTRLHYLCELTGLPRIHYHQLRHTHGSILLAKGVPMIAISRRLGHSNVSITQEIYVHEIAEAQHHNDDLILDAMEAIA
jgi:integrase